MIEYYVAIKTKGKIDFDTTFTAKEYVEFIKALENKEFVKIYDVKIRKHIFIAVKTILHIEVKGD